MLILQPGRSSLSNLRCLHDDDAMMYLAALQCAAKLVCYTMYAIIHNAVVVLFRCFPGQRHASRRIADAEAEAEAEAPRTNARRLVHCFRRKTERDLMRTR